MALCTWWPMDKEFSDVTPPHLYKAMTSSSIQQRSKWMCVTAACSAAEILFVNALYTATNCNHLLDNQTDSVIDSTVRPPICFRISRIFCDRYRYGRRLSYRCAGTRWWRWRRRGIHCRGHTASARWCRRCNIVVDGAPARQARHSLRWSSRRRCQRQAPLHTSHTLLTALGPSTTSNTPNRHHAGFRHRRTLTI